MTYYNDRIRSLQKNGKPLNVKYAANGIKNVFYMIRRRYDKRSKLRFVNVNLIDTTFHMYLPTDYCSTTIICKM